MSYPKTNKRDIVSYSKRNLEALTLPELDAMLKYCEDGIVEETDQVGINDPAEIDHNIHCFNVMIEIIGEARDARFYSVFEFPALPVKSKSK